MSLLRRTMVAAVAAAGLAWAQATADIETCLSQNKADCLAKDSVLLQVAPASLSAVGEHKNNNAHQCMFANPPVTPYYWDPTCANGGASEGCFADSVHHECRFCGELPYTGVECPKDAIVPVKGNCHFDNPPVSDYFWDPTCTPGMLGCLADNAHLGCRWCGDKGNDGAYAGIACPSVCTFVNDPMVPYFWDPKCKTGESLGCRADGIHEECRFCDMRPWDSVACPENVEIPADDCFFPNEQDMPHYMDEECEMGKLGCWADGIHEKCRYCGKGAYATIKCP
mmetsp:Transcript_15247/g.40466  ORF Transcript_15247/g.40466 Transcript_15247/m.40466 type:complete len:282 (-) Transcript_15247:66-911(-)